MFHPVSLAEARAVVTAPVPHAPRLRLLAWATLMSARGHRVNQLRLSRMIGGRA